MSVGTFGALITTQRRKSFSWSLPKLTNSGRKKFVPIRAANQRGLLVTITVKQGLGDIWMYLGSDLKFSAMYLAVNVHLVTESIELKSPGRVRDNISLKLLKDLHWR